LLDDLIGFVIDPFVDVVPGRATRRRLLRQFQAGPTVRSRLTGQRNRRTTVR
jgi:hypothetical protein